MQQTVGTLRPTARVIGIHKKFERAYNDYVDGCLEMIASIKDGINVEAFNASEQKQDEATEIIAFSIQRMTGILLGK